MVELGMISIEKANVFRKTVVVRANLDLLIDGDQVLEPTKINAILPTLELLRKAGNKVLLLAHLGEPVGEPRDDVSLMPIRFEIARKIGQAVKFVSIDNATNSIKYMEYGDILMFENLFFSKFEFSGSEEDRLKMLQIVIDAGQVYVDEAFGVDENLSSMNLLKSKIDNTYFGLNYMNEYRQAEILKTSAPSPKVGIIGGRFTKAKLEFLIRSLEKYDTWLFAGEFALDMLSAQGVSLGAFNSKVDPKIFEELLSKIDSTSRRVVYPVDHFAVNSSGETVEIATQSFEDEYLPKDVGPKTLILFREVIESSETIFWTGPVGVFEEEEFNVGTESVGEYIALSAPRHATKMACGSDTLLALSKLKIKHKRFTHLSTDSNKFLSLI